MLIISLILSLFLSPCAAEDSTNCYWSGGANQQGETFVDILGQPLYLGK